jgi:hypothetical protein
MASDILQGFLSRRTLADAPRIAGHSGTHTAFIAIKSYSELNDFAQSVSVCS